MKNVVFTCFVALLGCETVETASTGPDVGLVDESPGNAHLHTGSVVDSSVSVDASIGTVATGFEGTWAVTRSLTTTDCPPPVAQIEVDTWHVTGVTGVFVVTVEGDTSWPVLRSVEQPSGGPDVSLVGNMRTDGSRLGLDLWRVSANTYTGAEYIFVGTGCSVRRSLTATRVL